MAQPRIEPYITRITSDHPQFVKILEKMENIGALALKDDPLTLPTVAAYYSERPDLYRKFIRMQLDVGLIGGKLYGAFSNNDSNPENLVGLALWYEPGTEFMASEEEHGPWDAYMREISPETKQWWDEALLPKVDILIKAAFGEFKKDTTFQLQLLAVDINSRRQGTGAALCRHVLRKADTLGVLSSLETNSEENVLFYAALGFQVKESVLIPSRFGGFTMASMYRSPPSRT